ncbi:MAG: bacillithiol system redox-active protein YtxJ [Bacteroidetes bacterium]|nr:MAG: bacillithiol system redox-active protein YtxJ [Bacteroidota bacterium]
MDWNYINQLSELEAAIKLSEDKPVLLFKHSTRCSISTGALSRLERKWETETGKKVTPYFLDLIRYRQLSDAIAIQTGVQHESPQLIVLHKGKVLYSASHNGIVYDEIIESLHAA